MSTQLGDKARRSLALRGASYVIRRSAASAPGRMPPVRCSAAAWLGLRALPLGAGLAGLAACVSAPSVDVGLVGLAPEKSTLLEQRLRLDLRLQNFSDQAMRGRGFEVTLNLNGHRLARGVDNTGFELEALGETRISAVVSTSLFDVARQLLDLPDRETFSYELVGKVYLDGWPRSAGFRRDGAFSRAELSRLSGAGGTTPQPLRL